jgi:hypothetical protein
VKENFMTLLGVRGELLDNPIKYPTIKGMDGLFLDREGVDSFTQLIHKVCSGVVFMPDAVGNQEIVKLLVSTLEAIYPCLVVDSDRTEVRKVLFECNQWLSGGYHPYEVELDIHLMPDYFG